MTPPTRSEWSVSSRRRHGTTAVLGWAVMHALVPAAFAWLIAVPIIVVSARTTIPPFLNTTAAGEVPTALLIPLLGAGGAAFGLTHEAPALLASSTRAVLPWQLLWGAACLVPGAFLAAGAAIWSQQITVGAAERNALLLTAITVAALVVLPPGLSVLPAVAYGAVCLMLSANSMLSGLPAPTWAIALQRQATATQLVLAAAASCLAIAMHGVHQGRRG